MQRQPTIQMDRLAVRVPPGMVAGQAITFNTPAGQQFQAVIPAGVQAGQTFVVTVPSASAPPAAANVPMGLPVRQRSGSSPPQRAATSAPPAEMVRAGSRVDQLVAPAWQDGQALRHAECPICFEPLHTSAVGVFLDETGRRLSPHFFSLEADRSG